MFRITRVEIWGKYNLKISHLKQIRAQFWPGLAKSSFLWFPFQLFRFKVKWFVIWFPVFNKTVWKKCSDKKCHLLSKRTTDKQTLIQDHHHTLACFLVLREFVQSILIKSFILPLALFCYSVHYRELFSWSADIFIFKIKSGNFFWFPKSLESCNSVKT